MIIKKIIIKNYKQLDLEMKLAPNSNGFKPNERYFSSIENVPKIIGIGGPNAVGKTSIIEIFNFIYKFQLSPHNLPLIAEYMLEDKKIMSKVLNNKSDAVEIHHVFDQKFLHTQKLIDYFSKNFAVIKKDPVFSDAYWKAMNAFFAFQYEQFARNLKQDIELRCDVIEEVTQKNASIKFLINQNGVNILVELNENNDNQKIKENEAEMIFDKFMKLIRFAPSTFSIINSY